MAGHDILYYLNKNEQFDKVSLIEAAITKYFSRTATKEPVVILTDSYANVDVLYRHLKKFLSKLGRKIVYLPNHYCRDNLEHDYLNYVNEVEEYLKDPEGFLITDITSFNGAQARNIIVYTNELASKFIRNMVLRTLSFLILICNEGTQVRPAYGLQKDSDLLESIMNMMGDLYILQYENKYELSNSMLSTAVINKYFHDKSDESIIVITEENYGNEVFQELHQKFSSQRYVCHFKENEEFKWIDEIKQALDRKGSVLVVDADDSNLESLLLNGIKNIVMFARNEYCRHTFLCRNIFMRAKPKFAAIIHEGEIEEIDEVIVTTPVDDLHSYINFGSPKPKCYHYINDETLSVPMQIKMAVKKFLPEFLGGSTVIISSNNNLEDICAELNDNISEFIHVHPHHVSPGDAHEEHKDVFTEVLQVPGMILVVTPDFYFEGLSCLDSAQNFIVIDSSYDSEFLFKCRNLIIKANPKFTMIINDGNTKVFDPIFEMIPVNITI